MNFKDAITAHSRWKSTLTNYVNNPDGSLNPEEICKDNNCTLGMWIYKEAVELCKGDPNYDVLKEEHSQMHREAANVVLKINKTPNLTIDDLLGESSGFVLSSQKVIKLLEKFSDIYSENSRERANSAFVINEKEPQKILEKITWALEKSLISIDSKYEPQLVGRETIPHIVSLALNVNKAVSGIKQSNQRLLDNAGDGFLSINNKGIMNDEFSQAALEMLHYPPAGKKFSLIFGEDKVSAIEELLETIFSGAIDFYSMEGFLPKNYFLNLRYLEFTYKPIFCEENNLSDILVILKDVTRIKNIEKQASLENNLNSCLIKILSSKNDFYTILDEVQRLMSHKESIPDGLRSIHTLKGGFGFFGAGSLMMLCHEWETKLKEKATLDILGQAIADINDKTQVFLQTHNSILKIDEKSEKEVSIPAIKLKKFIEESLQEHPTQRHIDLIEQLLETPLYDGLSFLNDVAQNTAEKLDKEVKIIWNCNLSINAIGYEPLFLSFVHLIKNGIDHGIEDADEREMLGKPREGTITISASLKDDYYCIQFKDDGRGVDPERIKKKASENMNVEQFSDDQIVDLIFQPGFSSKENITEHSGRGVGLDAVRMEAIKRGGNVAILEYSNQGTLFEVKFKKLRLIDLNLSDNS